MSPGYIPPGSNVGLRFLPPSETPDARELWRDYGPAPCEHPENARADRWLYIHDSNGAVAHSAEPIAWCDHCDSPLPGTSKRVRMIKERP